MLRSLLFVPVLLLAFAGCAKKDVAQTGNKQDSTLAGPEQKVFDEGALQTPPQTETGVIVKSPPPGANDVKGNMAEGLGAHNTGDYAGAIQYFDNAIKAAPTNAEAYLYRGMSKVKSGNKSGGCDDLNTALKLGSTNAQQTIDLLCK